MDIEKLFEQAQKMQEQLSNIGEELAEKIYEGNSGGSEGVTVKMNGRNEMLEVLISDELMTVDNKEMLQDMILIATNDAIDQANKDREEQMGAA
ncbi:MAG: YbaB/EbfC family nucleoid-associated protein, partial [Solobacterium sp.]|nr:YbaB/EbfC family nucleoid-associated protein [Solobacterium sp.]